MYKKGTYDNWEVRLSKPSFDQTSQLLPSRAEMEGVQGRWTW